MEEEKLVIRYGNDIATIKKNEMNGNEEYTLSFINKTYYVANNYDKSEVRNLKYAKSACLVQSMDELFDIIEKQVAILTPKVFYNFIYNDWFFIAVKEFNFSIKPLAILRLEDDIAKDFIRNLIGGKESSIVVGEAANHFNWICPIDAIRAMWESRKIKAAGQEPFEKHHKLKKNGKVRIYYAPRDEIKKPLRKLNELLQRAFDHINEDFQVAYKKGKNVYANASLHKNKRYVFNIDLKDFYPSCKRELVAKYVDFMFIGAANKDLVVNMFLDTILIDDGLFIGNPISGCLANAILSKPVKYMKNICSKFDMGFSVYADDMSFSSDKFISEKFVLSIFDTAFKEYGYENYFKINTEKSVGFTGCNRKVTGVSINNRDEVTINRKYYKLIRAMIDHVSKGDKNVDIQKLRGKIAYATMIDDSGKVYRYLKKYEDTVKKYRLCSDSKMQELEKRFA